MRDEFDRSYQHYCRCGKTLDARMEALGGARFADRADINKEDWKAINAWISAVIGGLPSLALKTIGEIGGARHSHCCKRTSSGVSCCSCPAGRSSSDVSTLSFPHFLHRRVWFVNALRVRADCFAGDDPLAAAPSTARAGPRWGKSHPYPGTVTAVQGLCTLRDEGDKDTVRVAVDLGDSGLRYAPGDALGVWPVNPPQVRDEMRACNISVCSALFCLPTWLPSFNWHLIVPEQRNVVQRF